MRNLSRAEQFLNEIFEIAMFIRQWVSIKISLLYHFLELFGMILKNRNQLFANDLI